jgi:hypothetical protein
MWFCFGSCKCMFYYSITKMEKNNLKQRYAIRFCVKLWEGTTCTYEKSQETFGNDSLSNAEVSHWHNNFLNGWEMVENEAQSGRPTSVRTNTNVDHLRAFIFKTDVWQLKWSPLNLVTYEWNTILLHKISTWENCVQRRFQKFEW